MELVLADDFSGAAEIAGLAHRSGRKTALFTEAPADTPPPNAETVILDTNTRLIPPDKAASRIRRIGASIQAWQAERIFKKIDSVLRGPVLAELEATLDAFDLEDACVASANPSRSRIIRGGHYFVDGVPLHETPFSEDPIHPATTSFVEELVGRSKRVEFPDVKTEDDLVTLAVKLGRQTLAAGGADFYRARLGIGETLSPLTNIPTGERLWICGSRANREQRRRLFGSSGIEEIMIDPSAQPDALASRADHAAGKGIALTLPDQLHPSPETLESAIARAAKTLLSERRFQVVLLEGGATARAVVNALGQREFSVVGELASGVVLLRPENNNDLPPFLVKPGSYPWPESLFS